jgi:protein tyrosine phosphatase (PTP) superfamily phosphohydrolase (DUF442 family)
MINRRTLRFLQLLGFGIGLAIPTVGCQMSVETTTSSGGTPAMPSNVTKTAPGLAVSKPAVGNTSPLLQVDNCYLAGQPQVEDFAAFKAAGVTKVISLRDPSEINWDEQAAVEAAGMEFVQIAMGKPDQLTAEKIEQVCDLLQQAKEQDTKVVLHCGAAVRASAVWMAHYCVSQNASWLEAEAFATNLVKVPDAWKAPVKTYVEQNASRN